MSSSRKNPERTYPRTTTGPYFLGPFEPYCASIVADWKVKWGELGRLEGWMAKDFGMVCMVDARPIGDTQVELRVSRLPRRRGRGPVDMVNIYDVGQGVAQVLAATVALLVAERDQLVYIDEPELHLHPRAQGAMGRLLAFAAKDRGVRVVVETQSSLLLLAIQTLVAEGELPPGLVGLYWFQRDEDGATKVRPGSLDRAGAFEDWPVDFGDVELDAQRRYLDAGR